MNMQNGGLDYFCSAMVAANTRKARLMKLLSLSSTVRHLGQAELFMKAVRNNKHYCDYFALTVSYTPTGVAVLDILRGIVCMLPVSSSRYGYCLNTPHPRCVATYRSQNIRTYQFGFMHTLVLW